MLKVAYLGYERVIQQRVLLSQALPLTKDWEETVWVMNEFLQVTCKLNSEIRGGLVLFRQHLMQHVTRHSNRRGDENCVFCVLTETAAQNKSPDLAMIREDAEFARTTQRAATRLMGMGLADLFIRLRKASADDEQSFAHGEDITDAALSTDEPGALVAFSRNDMLRLLLAMVEAVCWNEKNDRFTTAYRAKLTDRGQMPTAMHPERLDIAVKTRREAHEFILVYDALYGNSGSQLHDSFFDWSDSPQGGAFPICILVESGGELRERLDHHLTAEIFCPDIIIDATL
jgi:hypothetical protein